jgi:colanic acid/amylovoran biosynthesis glycosyltransferase
MKNICFVVHTFPSISETFVTNQIIGAKKQGYSVCVLTYKLGSLEQSSQRDLIEKYEILNDTIIIDYKFPKTKLKRLVLGLLPTIKYYRYWVKPINVSMKHRILNWPFFLEFYSKLRHIDVFHIQNAMLGRGIAEMKENGLLKAKLVTTFHGHDAHYRNEKVLKQLQNFYRILFKVSDYVTVNTPYLETQVVALGCERKRIYVIPMAIDVDYFKSDLAKELPDKSEIKLISVGRLIEFKGFEFAINAVKLLIKNGMQVHYTIVGEGVLFDCLQDQIDALKLKGFVKLVGKKNQNDIKILLQTHHLFLMSSITDSTGRSETQGVVTAEAQAMGLPVVAFNNGGIPYTIRDGQTGVLVESKDVGAYSQAILELISHPDRYQLMSQKARELASTEFSNTLMSKRFTKLYEN